MTTKNSVTARTIPIKSFTDDTPRITEFGPSVASSNRIFFDDAYVARDRN